MKYWLRRFGWPLAKIVLGLAIVIGVGRHFTGDLLNDDWTALNPKLAGLTICWSWLALSAGLYLLFLALSAFYWYCLLRLFGEKPTFFGVGRAYYIGHLGKYVPGKAWALILRGSLAAGPDVRFGTAVLTSFYEVLTTMAAGALLAVVIFIVQPPHVGDLEWHPALTALLVLGLVGVPLLPGVFNMLMQNLARRFEGIDTFKAPRMRGRILAAGLLMTGAGWAILGVSVWACLVAVLDEAPELTMSSWAQFAAAISSLSYVVGFLALVVPGGIGVREILLLNLLGFVGPEARIALAVVLMRLIWTAAELAAAVGLQLAESGKVDDGKVTSIGTPSHDERQQQGGVWMIAGDETLACAYASG